MVKYIEHFPDRLMYILPHTPLTPDGQRVTDYLPLTNPLKMSDADASIWVKHITASEQGTIPKEEALTFIGRGNRRFTVYCAGQKKDAEVQSAEDPEEDFEAEMGNVVDDEDDGRDGEGASNLSGETNATSGSKKMRGGKEGLDVQPPASSEPLTEEQRQKEKRKLEKDGRKLEKEREDTAAPQPDPPIREAEGGPLPPISLPLQEGPLYKELLQLQVDKAQLGPVRLAAASSQPAQSLPAPRSLSWSFGDWFSQPPAPFKRRRPRRSTAHSTRTMVAPVNEDDAPKSPGQAVAAVLARLHAENAKEELDRSTFGDCYPDDDPFTAATGGTFSLSKDALSNIQVDPSDSRYHTSRIFIPVAVPHHFTSPSHDYLPWSRRVGDELVGLPVTNINSDFFGFDMQTEQLLLAFMGHDEQFFGVGLHGLQEVVLLANPFISPTASRCPEATSRTNGRTCGRDRRVSTPVGAVGAFVAFDPHRPQLTHRLSPVTPTG